MVVLDSSTKNIAPLLRVPPWYASMVCLTIYLTQKSYNNTVPLLSSVKILTMQSVENFKNFQIYQYFI